jgi:hypothetical protein
MENQQAAEEAPKPALPLLALLVLASALGVGVAIALAALAMLLAAPAYADEAATGGGLVLERPTGPAWADRLFVEREAQPDGVTRVLEAYQNPFDEPLAGVYVHRLPQGAVLERLAFNSDLRPAVLMRRPARAVLERTAEIGPGETLFVELEYRAPAARRLIAQR